MSDLDDKNLNNVSGDDQPSSSQTGNNNDAADGKTEEDSKTVGAGTPSEEELEWAKLSGRTQDRVRDLIRQRNEALSKTSDRAATELRDKPSIQTDADLSPEDLEAKRQLKRLGVVTREETVSKADLQVIQDRMTLDREHERLTGKYSGTDGKPAYISEEVEEYARKTGVYNLEAAYNQLFFDEIVDWTAKQRGASDVKATTPYTAQPKTASKEEPMSAESVAERLRRPDGRVWWEKNREKVLNAMPELIGS